MLIVILLGNTPATMKTSWKAGIGLVLIIGLIILMVRITYSNISVLREELMSRKGVSDEIILINSLILKTEDFYSYSNLLQLPYSRKKSEILQQKNDSIVFTLQTVDSLAHDKPYAKMVDTVAELYSKLLVQTSRLLKLKGLNELSFDTALLHVIAQTSDSLKKDTNSLFRNRKELTTVVVEKPVLINNTNNEKKKKKKQATSVKDTLPLSISSISFKDTMLTDSSFITLMDSAFGIISNEVIKLRESEANKLNSFTSKARMIEINKREIYSRLNKLLLTIQKLEQDRMKTNNLYAFNESNRSLRILTLMFWIVGILASFFSFWIIWDLRKLSYYRRKIEIEKMNAEAHAKSKEDFLAVMSHELRTPLNAITGFAGMLKKSTSEEKDVYAGYIEKSTGYLLTLIDNTLDLTKLENGTAIPDPVNFNLEQCILEVHMIMKVLADQKGLQYIVRNENLNVWISGDKLWLNQVLFNLIGNAIKYTPLGNVEIISSVTEGLTSVDLKVRVRDSGAGISNSVKQILFQPYKKGKKGGSEKGTGLGLPITKKLIEYQGGNLAFLSEENKGSEFVFSIPYKKGKEVIQGKFGGSAPAPDLTNTNVLVADDDVLSLRLVKTMFTKWNATITTCNEFSCILEKINTHSYAIILLDWNLNDHSALEILEELQEKKIHSLIIIHSAEMGIKEMVSKFKLDIQILPKPMHPEKLESIITTFYAKKQSSI